MYTYAGAFVRRFPPVNDYIIRAASGFSGNELLLGSWPVDETTIWSLFRLHEFASVTDSVDCIPDARYKNVNLLGEGSGLLYAMRV